MSLSFVEFVLMRFQVFKCLSLSIYNSWVLNSALKKLVKCIIYDSFTEKTYINIWKSRNITKLFLRCREYNSIILIYSTFYFSKFPLKQIWCFDKYKYILNNYEILEYSYLFVFQSEMQATFILDTPKSDRSVIWTHFKIRRTHTEIIYSNILLSKHVMLRTFRCNHFKFYIFYLKKCTKRKYELKWMKLPRHWLDGTSRTITLSTLKIINSESCLEQSPRNTWKNLSN